MPETMTITQSALTTGNADAFALSRTVTGNRLERVSPAVPAAKTGTLTTRTDNDTGTLTMTAGHGFVTNTRVDVFWNSGANYRRNMLPTVTGDSVVVDGGAGDVLPAVNTPVTAMVPAAYDFSVIGNNVKALSVSGERAGVVVFQDNANTPADIATAVYRIGASAAAQIWDDQSGVTNPLANTTTAKATFSHWDSSQAVNMKAAAIVN